MSTIIMSRCWPLSLPAVAKAVLISLADQANDHGVCWPSISTICMRTCYGERAVQNAVKLLQEMGLLKVEIGAMKANRYTLLVQNEPLTPAPHAPPHHVHPRTTCTPPPHHVHPNRNRTISNTPPLPPKGGEPLPETDPDLGNGGVQPPARSSKPPVTMEAWLAQCRELRIKPIPSDDAVLRYAERIGLPDEFLLLQWQEFKRRHLGSGKRQADWRRKFRNSVESNWYRLWYIGADGVAKLTTQGVQAQRVNAEPAADGEGAA